MFVASLFAVIGALLGFANPVLRVPGLILLFPAGLAYAALNAKSLRQAWRFGYWTGFAAALSSLFWTAIPIHYYGNLPWWLAAPVPALMCLYLALFPALFTLLLRYVRDRLPIFASALFAGCLWAALDMARGWLLSGFPWLVLPAALAPWPFAIQAAAYIGAYGLSGLLAACAMLAVSGRLAPTLAGILLLAGIGIGGGFAVNAPLPEDGTITAAVVQGNIEQARKWDPAYQEATVDQYLELSRAQADATGADLLVWPETAMPFYFQKPDALRKRVTDFARDNALVLVTGAPAAARDAADEGYVFFNRAFLVGPDGEIAGSYDKEHLVPFGEYVPFSQYLPFVKKLVEGAGDFQAGTSPAPLVSGDLALGMLICYEAIFPELAQKRVAAGANLLVNISNDAWFGDSPAPRQHLDLTLLRAVEQGRYIVRATNTGISAVIDPKGRILAQSGLFKAESLGRADVGLITAQTWFHRLHGFLAAGILGLTILLPFAGPLFRSRRNGKTGKLI